MAGRFRTVLLEEVAEINPRLDRSKLPSLETPVSFVPMAAVDEASGEIATHETRALGRVLKGFTAFREGDVLFAKITPCMQNGKSAIATNLINGLGFGSTEFYVLRPREAVLAEWLRYFVRQPKFRREAERNFTGTGGQQRVPIEFMRRAEIRLPSLFEQHRVVDILSRAEGIVRLRREAQRKAAELIPAEFLESFGDPITNPKGWPTERLGAVGVLERGKSRHRPRDARELYGGTYPFIQTGEVANSEGSIARYSVTYSDFGLAQSRLWPKGTLCITIAANIAKAGVLEFDACFPDSVVGFLHGKRITTGYVQAWLAFLQPTLEASAPQAAQKNINLEVLRNLLVPVPPLTLQHAYEDRCRSVQSIIGQARLALTTAQELFQSLLHQAFRANL